MILRSTPWFAVPGGATVIRPSTGARYRVGQRDDLRSVVVWPDAPFGHLAAQRIPIPTDTATVIVAIAEEQGDAVALLLAAFPGAEVLTT